MAMEAMADNAKLASYRHNTPRFDSARYPPQPSPCAELHRLRAVRYNLGALWSWTRHPNFSGEMMCWIGVAVSASNLGSVWSWSPLVAAASPSLTAVLMLFEAGLLAEWKNNHRYGATWTALLALV